MRWIKLHQNTSLRNGPPWLNWRNFFWAENYFPLNNFWLNLPLNRTLHELERSCQLTARFRYSVSSRDGWSSWRKKWKSEKWHPRETEIRKPCLPEESLLAIRWKQFLGLGPYVRNKAEDFTRTLSLVLPFVLTRFLFLMSSCCKPTYNMILHFRW